jgi:transposase-like protein
MLSPSTIWRKVITKKTRRRYTPEFKAAAFTQLDGPGETLSGVA